MGLWEHDLASSTQPSFTLWPTDMEHTGGPGSAPWWSRLYPWSVFGPLLPFSPLLLAHSVHAEENLLPSYAPCSHESYPAQHLERKNPSCHGIQGTDLPLEPLVRPDTQDAEPFSADPTSTRTHGGRPCFKSRVWPGNH